jgi:hypothetical protein
VGLVIGLLASAGIALAVHDEDFQLDGDVLSSTTTNKGGSIQPVDWDAIFNADGSTKASLPAGFDDAALTKDFNNTGNTFLTNDTTTYATGSKDTLPISGWQCNFDNNVNSKIDVMNAYATSYQLPANTGDEFMYFALERNTNTGTADVGFWFLQDEVGCSSTGGAVTFTGEHRDGDVLIVSEFSNGGTVSTINVYRWDRNNGNADCSLNPIGPACVLNPVGVPGSLNPNSIGSGVDCRSANTLPGDAACAAANTTANGTGGTISTPWLTANFKDKVGHSLRTSEFFEGGINLTDLHLGGKCFNTFIGDTRSSTSLTATLFDFAAGVTGSCTSETVTTPSITTGQIPADPNDASISVTDTAAITVTGVSTWSGDVSWHLCKVASPDLCGTGGVAVGAAKTASNSVPSVTSDAAIVTAAGRYCWRADFAGDAAAGVPPSSDSRSSECFVISPRQPTLVTQATTGPVDFGQKISDVATLANTAHKPGTGGPAGADGSINPATLGGDATGDITLTAYGPDSCSTIAYGPVSIAASGDGNYGGTATTFEFTPAAPGQYVFVTSYAGDSPNTLGVPATACSGQPAAEKVTVRTIPTEIATTPSYFPQDSATINSSVAGNNLAANGTVTFSLYGATAGPVTALANCQAGGTTGRVYGPEAVSTGAAAHSVTVGTNNTTTRISTSGKYYWLVTYATPAGDTAHTGSQSNCVENIDATLTGDAGPGTIFPTPAP